MSVTLEILNPGSKMDPGLKHARMTMLCLLALFVVAGCKPTYKKETIKESVKMLALKEYGLNVDVKEAGTTLGLRFKVKNLLSEIYSGDNDINKKINGLFMVLVRVALSVDEPPEFIVLDILDEDNPRFHLVFTRYVEDLKKLMAEALSYSQNQDRVIEEFVIGGKHVQFDAEEMDLVRLMMMAMDGQGEGDARDQEFNLEAVQFKKFVSRVAENRVRRLLREEKSVNREALIRQVSASFERGVQKDAGFRVLLDMVSQPQSKLSPVFLETKVLPLALDEIAQLFKSYRFHDFAAITVVEKNSGKILSRQFSSP